LRRRRELAAHASTNHRVDEVAAAADRLTTHRGSPSRFAEVTTAGSGTDAIRLSIVVRGDDSGG
jgi:hypothetical protein